MTHTSFVAMTGLPPRPGATDTEVAEAERSLGSRLPEEYRAFLRESNGLEGFVANDAYLVLWTASDIVELNAGYATREFAPGLVLLGSDGGDTGYGYLASGPRRGFVEVPLVGMSIDAAKPIGTSLPEFLKRLRSRR